MPKIRSNWRTSRAAFECFMYVAHGGKMSLNTLTALCRANKATVSRRINRFEGSGFLKTEILVMEKYYWVDFQALEKETDLKNKDTILKYMRASYDFNEFVMGAKIKTLIPTEILKNNLECINDEKIFKLKKIIEIKNKQIAELKKAKRLNKTKKAWAILSDLIDEEDIKAGLN